MRVTMATSAADPDRPNEDFAAALPHAVVLLDGAGIPVHDSCSHGVAWYTRRLGGALVTHLSGDDGRSLAALLAASISDVSLAHRDTCDVDSPHSPSATVIVFRCHGDRADYLVLADSVLVLDQVDGGPTVICDDRAGEIGARYRAAMRAAAHGTPEHDGAHLDCVEAVRAHRNQPDGFWVAAADPGAASEALTGSRPVRELRGVALLSDGASRIVDRFGLADWPDLIAVLDGDGPGEVVRRVRAAERSDRQGRLWPRAKIYDDATVAYCTALAEQVGGGAAARTP
ncbi:protein phosphatase 2C domain-containing protein [Micromonospora sp. NPDC049679]|uniref:protein phosphatase 2C domain-containing protein n=1 Tax=Micromonospora sp. NPDC049679 TaxID=3155920 RepID=UPI0033F8FD12